MVRRVGGGFRRHVASTLNFLMSFIAPYYTTAGRLAVEVHPDRVALGRAAARAVAAHLHGVIARPGEARVIFACAPSQNEFLAALVDPAHGGLALWVPPPPGEAAAAAAQQQQQAQAQAQQAMQHAQMPQMHVAQVPLAVGQRW